MKTTALLAVLLLAACGVEDPSADCEPGEFYVPANHVSAAFAAPEDLGTCQPLRGVNEPCASSSWCRAGLACVPAGGRRCEPTPAQ